MKMLKGVSHIVIIGPAVQLPISIDYDAGAKAPEEKQRIRSGRNTVMKKPRLPYFDFYSY